MDIKTAVERTGGELIGGQLIVMHEGKHLLVGRHQDGVFLPEQTDAAKAFMASLPDPLDHDQDGKKGGRKPRAAKPAEPDAVAEPVVEPVAHELVVEDAAVIEDETT